MIQFAAIMIDSLQARIEPPCPGASVRRHSMMYGNAGRSWLRRMNSAAAAILASIVLLAGGYTAWSGEKIALFASSNDAPFQEAIKGFREHLAGQRIQAGYEMFSLESDLAKAGPAIQKIKAGGARLVVTLGSMATDAALREITDGPVVACMVLRTDNLKNSPNATGVGLEFPLETQFAWIQRLLPDAMTVGVLYNPGENQKRINTAVAVAIKAGLQLVAYQIDTPQDIPAALDSLSRKADVLWGLTDSMTLSPSMAKNILLFSFRNSIPFIGPSATWVKAGALYSLDWDYADLGAQCGQMAQKILAGAAPSSLPPATPRKVLYSLNLATARQMKLTVPEPIVRGARQTY
jgi:putative ABC transport system substrate-binding protein